MAGPHRGDAARAATLREERARAAGKRHWRRSLRLVAVLLVLWFAVSFGCGILFREQLDRFTLPGTGFPLGFWFAQQGAIVAFVLLVGVYVVAAERIDRRLEEERNRAAFDEPAEDDR